MSASPITLSETQPLLAPLGVLSSRRAGRVGRAGQSRAPASCGALAYRADRRPGAQRADGRSRPPPGLARRSRAMVGRLASELGLPHAILTWARSEARAASLQARARAARYDLMVAYCHANDIPALVTAHHLDDQAETFLMRLKRGSGLDGLAAIPERGRLGRHRRARPLLDVPKARLVATLDAAGIAFVSDPSNVDPRFERARLRRSGDALAVLGLTPEALALSARRLRRARAGARSARPRRFSPPTARSATRAIALVAGDALATAPQEIALRALAQIDRRPWAAARRPCSSPSSRPCLSPWQASRASPTRSAAAGSSLTPAGSASSARCRGRGCRWRSFCPGSAHCGTTAFSSSSARRSPSRSLVRALGESRLARPRDAFGAGLVAAALGRARTLPACWRGDAVVGATQAWARPRRMRASASLARRSLRQRRQRKVAGTGPLHEPLRKHAPLCVSFTWQRAMHVPMLPSLSLNLVP